MKLCILGNSHLASLKNSWVKLKRKFSNLEVDFFAHRKDGLKGLKVNGNFLVCDDEPLKRALNFTSGGKHSINLKEYDGFILYGLDAKGDFLKTGIHYSQAVVEAACYDSTKDTTSFDLLLKIRQVTHKPVIVGHDPLLAAEASKCVKGDISSYLMTIKMLNELIYRPRQAVLLRQPEDTITNGYNTSIRYSIGSTRLAIGKPDDNQQHAIIDRKHMNDEFGGVWLTHALDAFRSGKFFSY